MLGNLFAMALHHEAMANIPSDPKDKVKKEIDPSEADTVKSIDLDDLLDEGKADYFGLGFDSDFVSDEEVEAD